MIHLCKPFDQSTTTLVLSRCAAEGLASTELLGNGNGSLVPGLVLEVCRRERGGGGGLCILHHDKIRERTAKLGTCILTCHCPNWVGVGRDLRSSQVRYPPYEALPCARTRGGGQRHQTCRETRLSLDSVRCMHSPSIFSPKNLSSAAIRLSGASREKWVCGNRLFLVCWLVARSCFLLVARRMGSWEL